MEHIIEQEPELIAENGYKITDGEEGIYWSRITLYDWSTRDKYYAIKEEDIPQPEPEDIPEN